MNIIHTKKWDVYAFEFRYNQEYGAVLEIDGYFIQFTVCFAKFEFGIIYKRERGERTI